jgi:hypothetical protein
MRKMRLELDDLDVESFDTRPSEAGRGTVKGHATQYGSCQGSCVQTCGGPTCESPCEVEPTMYLTCMESCGWTGGGYVCIYC